MSESTLIVEDEEDFALLHVDLKGFKSYNDHYGFLQGDRAIVQTAHIVVSAAKEHGGEDAFVGHIGGDDFVVVCSVDHAEAVAERITVGFDREVGVLYKTEDRDRGFIELTDRAGVTHRHPLLSVSVGVASSRVRPFASSTEAAAVAVELKRFAKAVLGWTWRIDRRTS